MQEALSHGPVSQLLPCDLLTLDGAFWESALLPCCWITPSITEPSSVSRAWLSVCLIATPIKVMDQESFPLETQSF